MHLNHINIPVPDVAACSDFLKTFFDMKPLGYKESHVMSLLTDGHGMVLNIENFDRQSEVTYPSTFHIGFMRDSREAVDEVHRRLTEAGYAAEPPRVFHGAWTFYVKSPAGFTVEVQHLESQPPSRNTGIAS